ncbi:reprolysin-like metallopeptidase [Gelatiniphilus marinus]|uniref:Reprolysin-like metallopeptidase n=1 Tax=Gelatiniphilus marinus TaxID=1759464 RepID=A0ABW5JW95_9FLAO
MKTKLHYVLSIAILLFIFSATAQNTTWKKIEHIENPENLAKLNLNNDTVHLFELNASLLQQEVLSTPLRNAKKKTSVKTISVPGLHGEFESFNLFEAPVFSTELAAKYPNIKSYVGVSTKDPKTRLRMSVSPQGVQTMISYVDKPTVFMQPIKKGSNAYVLYKKHSKNKSNHRFECNTIDELNEMFNKSSKSKANEGGANNQTLQKFRIAVSTTAEYTAYHDDGIPGNGNAVADALAAINATLTRVNQVFETDMAVTFELISNNNLVVYTDAATDPYSDASVGADSDNSNNLSGWSLQVQNTLSSVIGNAAYDIGHLFGASGGGGNAGCIGCVCSNDDTSDSFDKNKGSAFTSPADAIPEGDTFDIDYVAHEIGHQMGANHTWAFDSEGTGVNSEPGSGTTIMAYAGITGPDNVALNSDDYFHYHSIKQILDNLATKSCQTTEAIANNPPIADAGNDYNIPKGTAYVLKGAATDTDGSDNLTYCWEQIDSGVTNYQNFGPTLLGGSMNRSLPPTGFSYRYIPKFSSVVSGNTTQTNPVLGSDWETVSTVARTLKWALTVRDRSPSSASGGQTSYDTMQINVEDVTPFTVTNPIYWVQGTTETINWEVGQTTNGTINCQTVNIKLSTDGGLKFLTPIATNVPNNGAYTFTVPAVANTDKARILVEAADNIFYDVSDFDFLITTEPDFLMINETLDPIGCGNTAVFHFDFITLNSFSETTTFSATGNPGASVVSFSPSARNTSGPVTMTVSNLDAVPQNDYNITITATPTPTSSLTKSKDVNLPFYNQICGSVANTTYSTSTTLVEFNTINNSTGKGDDIPVPPNSDGYSDYTSISTNLNRNSSYNLTVHANTDGDFTTSTAVWIDWNQNCSFDDAGEAYNLGDATNTADGATGNSPLSIVVPNDAVLGSTIMRVSTKFSGDGNPIACENGFDGEVEDYTLNVQASLAVEEFGFDNFVVFPNPNKGEFTIKLNSSLSSTIYVEVFDLRGRTIYKNTYKDTGDFNEKVNLNMVQSGMYILNVSDGLRTSTKKIIVE